VLTSEEITQKWSRFNYTLPTATDLSNLLPTKQKMGLAYKSWNPLQNQYALGLHASPERFPTATDDPNAYLDPLFYAPPEYLSLKWCSPNDPAVPAILSQVPSSYSLVGTPPLPAGGENTRVIAVAVICSIVGVSFIISIGIVLVRWLKNRDFDYDYQFNEFK